MPHVLTISVDNYNGLVPTLECTEPPSAPCRAHAGDGCSIVQVFSWDSAASMEGYAGAKFDACKVAIKVLEASEDTFDWELAGEAP